MHSFKKLAAAVATLAAGATVITATPASAYGEQTVCNPWRSFSGYSGPSSIGNGYRDMYIQTCIHKTIAPNGDEYFAGSSTVFNGSGTSQKYGYNYGHWGSRELIFNKMVGEGLTANSNGKTLKGWYPNNDCFHGEIKVGQYKTCTSSWFKDDSPGTANRVSTSVLAYAWVPQTGMNTYEKATFSEVDESPYLN
ncbi:hypothetical protein [Streptomyces sp. NPDC053431]|uniref:hypothetical protein n=1 Tax=Streptomyces sp. NPDC053431 TaxID=3365703 RepID=UPI0037D2A1FB